MIIGCQVWVWQIVIRKFMVAEPPVEPAPEPFDHSRIVAHASERREEPLLTGVALSTLLAAQGLWAAVSWRRFQERFPRISAESACSWIP